MLLASSNLIVISSFKTISMSSNVHCQCLWKNSSIEKSATNIIARLAASKKVNMASVKLLPNLLQKVRSTNNHKRMKKNKIKPN